MYSGGDRNSGDYRAAEVAREQKIRDALKQIDQNFSGFDDQFYQQRENDYAAFAAPQLAREHDLTQNNLTYSLARRGLLHSGTAVSQNAALATETAQQERNMADAGRAQAAGLRTSIEGQRSNLYAQAQASADPGAAYAQSLRTAQNFQQPLSFQPIGNFFQNWTQNYLSNQTARQYDPQIQPLFSWGGDSGGSSMRAVK